jgi:hypothetical protein
VTHSASRSSCVARVLARVMLIVLTSVFFS